MSTTSRRPARTSTRPATGTDSAARTRRHASGRVSHRNGGLLTDYTAVLPDTGAMGGYVYAAGFGSGTVWFVAPLFDADTGEPLAVLDGAAMNPGKTAAAGAVGTDALARPDASTVGLIGSGRQARAALRATATVRDLDRVRVQSPTPAHRRELAADPPVDVPHEAVDAPAAAVRDADIVITVTTASEPVFDGDDLRPGTHVTAMGQYHPDRRELDATTVARLTV